MRLALWTAAVEAACFLAFVAVASTRWASVGKPMAIAAGLGAVLVSAWLAAASHVPRELGGYALIVAAGNLTFFEALAYTVFPGLAKDLDFLSVEHGGRALALFAISFVAHFAAALALRLMRRMAALRTRLNR